MPISWRVLNTFTMMSSRKTKSRSVKRQVGRAKGEKGASSSNNVDGHIAVASLSGVVERWTPLFPASTARRLRYYDNVFADRTSGSVWGHLFSANGLYDPDITSTGHQPMGFDQMMLSYEHYTVYDATITVQFRNRSSAFAVDVCVWANPNNSVVNDFPRIREFGNYVHEVLSPLGTDGSIKRVSMTLDLAKIIGRQKLLDSDSCRGDIGANPAEEYYFQVMSWDSNLQNTSVLAEVTLEYTAVFTEPRLLTQSQTKIMKEILLTQPGEGFVKVKNSEIKTA